MQETGARQEFRVVVDGVRLDREMTERINSAIQKAVLTELAVIDHDNLAIHWDREWLGIWLESLRQIIERGKMRTPQELGIGER